jgi:fructose-specific phosphotransferase system IIB component
MKFVVVTACPTGIAHSAMAAEALEQAAIEKGHEIQIEIHGASGAEFVDSEAIRDADAIIFALDATVAERERFVGRRPSRSACARPSTSLPKSWRGPRPPPGMARRRRLLLGRTYWRRTQMMMKPSPSARAAGDGGRRSGAGS